MNFFFHRSVGRSNRTEIVIDRMGNKIIFAPIFLDIRSSREIDYLQEIANIYYFCVEKSGFENCRVLKENLP